jgi:hypothetical protein
MMRAAGTNWIEMTEMTRAFTFDDHNDPVINIRLEYPTVVSLLVHNLRSSVFMTCTVMKKVNCI